MPMPVCSVAPPLRCRFPVASCEASRPRGNHSPVACQQRPGRAAGRNLFLRLGVTVPLASRQESSSSDAGPSTSTPQQNTNKAKSQPSELQKLEQRNDSSSNNNNSDGDNRNDSWLSRLNILKLLAPQKDQGRPPLVLRLWRYIIVLFLVAAGAFGREFVAPRAPAPQEVLYSDFVRLVDQRSVVAARLEPRSGGGRLYFEPRPGLVPVSSRAGGAKSAQAQQQAAEAAAAAAAAAAATTAASSSSASAAAPFTSSAAAPASTSSAAAQSHLTPVGRAHPVTRRFFVSLPERNDPPLVARMIAAGVQFAVVKSSVQSVLLNVLVTTLTLWIPLLPLFFIVRRLLDARNLAGGTKKKAPSKVPPTTFADVAGVSGAKEELTEVVACLRNSQRYSRLAAKMPSGVLLCGPPGTGKTLLARAVAGEAGVPFLAVSASEFVELFVGRGAARIRELFAEARKLSPCVVFIDELDAVGGRRGGGFNDERDQTLNQLLTELDGFEGRGGVLLLAATNRAEMLDPALLRPGRISRKVVVPLPDEPGRAEILAVHLRSVPLGPEGQEEDKADVCLRLARVTPGFSGAELANVVNEATLLAARRDREVVTMAELIEGVQRTRFGVNGRGGGSGGGNGVGGALRRWLMDIASSPQPPGKNSRQVKVGSG